MSKSRDAADQINRVNSSAANATAITIDSSENVGIGTSSAARKLEIAGNNNAGAKANYIRITDTDTTATAGNQQGGIEFFSNDVTPGIAASIEVLYAGSGGGGELIFNTNVNSQGTLTEAVRIDESGNVGIGESNPTAKIHATTTTSGLISAGAARQGSVIKLHHEAHWEAGYNSTPTDFLGALEFSSSDDSGSGLAGAGVRAAIRATVQDAYNNVGLTFETGGTRTERMRIDATGAVTMPAQPAFSAINNTAAQTNLAINTYHTIVFGGEVFDQGSDFASNTFTAPVTGRYQFNLQIRLYQIDAAASYYQAYITTSNRNYEAALITPLFTSDPTYMTLSSSFLVDMDAADTAFVQFFQAGGSVQTDLQQACSTFSGYLVA